MKNSLAFAFLTALVACQAAPPRVDLEAARKGILDADAAWSKTTTDAAAFASFFASDGILLPPDSPLIQGHTGITDWATQMIKTPGLSVTWTASKADVAGSGDMGFSTGTYQMSLQGQDGKPMTIHGKYVTVWKKQADGSWKVAADTFNPNGPPVSGTSE